MRRCRRCKTPKWGSDPCTNPTCPVNTTPTVRLKSRSKPTTATVKHGFHALNTTGFVQTMSDYDTPIWRVQ
jgi:hypothetical protein